MEIDFITAFGRLLREGKLRDTFARNPQAAATQIQLRPADLPAWVQLVPADVEFQATVLLHKRLETVKHFAPETCRRPGEMLWPLFQDYARNNWPSGETPKIFDTFQFCQHLEQRSPGKVAASEWNRLQFALSKRHLAAHWVRLTTNRKAHWGLQLFYRSSHGRWREFFFYLGL